MTRTIEHVITGLDIGGAELMLSNLARRGVRYQHSITSLCGNGQIAADLKAYGVGVTELGMSPNLWALAGIQRVARNLAEAPPVLVQTWLYHADLVGGLAARRVGLPVVWNIRQTNVERGGQKLKTALVVRLCAMLSRSLPSKIVCASNSAMATHQDMGFDGSKMLVINNGVDTDEFHCDPAARLQMRAELGIAEDTLVVGRVGRYHVQKNYKGFIETAGLIAQALPNVRFVLVGDGVHPHNTALMRWIEARGLSRLFILLGPRRDVARIMPAFDLMVSSSTFGEGFPNVIAEAMACEVPCVATDVGDSQEIIGRQNHVVAAGDHVALARSAVEVLRQPKEVRERIGRECRERVAARYAMGTMIERYESLYDTIYKQSAASARARLGFEK